MFSKGFGQIRYRNKRGFQVPDTSFCSIKQPLKSNCTSYVESSSVVILRNAQFSEAAAWKKLPSQAVSSIHSV